MVSFMCRKAAWTELTARVTLVEAIRGFDARFLYFMHIKTSGRAVLLWSRGYECRRTYCSNMIKLEINSKTLQYYMGHSDIGVTVDIKNLYEQLNRVKTA